MDKLLQPDFGLMFWTIVNFTLLALLLTKLAWRPLVNALEKREKQIKDDVSSAQKAREDAQKIQQQLQAQMEASAKEASAKINEAKALGEKQKDAILQEAKTQSAQLINAAKQQIEADTQKAIAAVRAEVVNTTMLAVKKVIGKEADAKTSAQLVDELLADIKK